MKKLAPGAFQVKDGEVITVDVKSTGATTLFGVNFSIFGGGSPLTEGEPLKVTMDKSKAQGKAAPLTLLFSFSSNSGGKYEWTITGDPGGDSLSDFTRQAGKGPKAVTYFFEIT